MQVSLEALMATFITTLCGAMGTVFWLYVRTQGARLSDFQDRVKKYDEEVLPALQRLEQALVKLTDLYEMQGARQERQERK